MKDVVFWDVDTQIDFIEPDGKLYVPGAERLKPNLAYLTKLGAEKSCLLGSIDAHLPDDPEFSDWPEHCVYGTPGQLKISETISEGILFVPSRKMTESQLMEVVDYNDQLIFEKQDNDVRTNKNVTNFMEQVNPSLVVVYGVVSEICVNLAVNFLAGDLELETVVVSDAIKELDLEKLESCRINWDTLGAQIIKTNEVKRLF